MTSLGPQDEEIFKKWYSDYSSRMGLDPNPDDPQHFYDYRGAFAAGAQPDAHGHMPSQFKVEGHPRMIIDGVNTKTGRPESGFPNRGAGFKEIYKGR